MVQMNHSSPSAPSSPSPARQHPGLVELFEQELQSSGDVPVEVSRHSIEMLLCMVEGARVVGGELQAERPPQIFEQLFGDTLGQDSISDHRCEMGSSNEAPLIQKHRAASVERSDSCSALVLLGALGFLGRGGKRLELLHELGSFRCEGEALLLKRRQRSLELCLKAHLLDASFKLSVGVCRGDRGDVTRLPCLDALEK